MARSAESSLGGVGEDVADPIATEHAGADLGIAREEVEGGHVVPELVRLRAEGEALRVLRVGKRDEGEIRRQRAEARRIGHVDLDAAAHDAGVLVKRRLEGQGAARASPGAALRGATPRGARASIQGAPTISKGRVVPRPSERLVPLDEASSR